jgi:hypothetical protein
MKDFISNFVERGKLMEGALDDCESVSIRCSESMFVLCLK